MPLRVSEAIVLRTYPLRESDKIVSFFTREFGKCRGVSRGARRPKSKFGASLEPLSHIRITFFERENRDLSNIDHCEVLGSMMTASLDFATGVASSYIAEVADKMLPDHEASDAVFRLMLLVLKTMRERSSPWLPLTYFMYWMVRLGGFLPDLNHCSVCRKTFEAGEDACFYFSTEGLLCAEHSPSGATKLSASSRQIAATMARTSLEQMDLSGWESSRHAADLREFLNTKFQEHLEARLQSWPMLANL